MKKLVIILIGRVSLHVSTLSALDFPDSTIFIEAKTQEECHRLGGSFITRYNESYCTTNAQKARNFEIYNMITSNRFIIVLILVLSAGGLYRIIKKHDGLTTSKIAK